ncbi:NADH-cytochrome b5 reductase [Exophiala xenobiotica]|nr:NADH-cytochrome b5 reductase [Exophiala xenobiotica]
MATLKIGDTMKVRGPKGAMVYTPNLCKRIGMIAGGTGITPMLQIIRAINRGRPRNGGNDTTKVDLIFANVNPDDILLKEQLDALDKEDPDFSVYYVLNNPPTGWTGGVGFVTPDMIKQKLPPPATDMKILLCGPPPMVSAMKKATESLGYQKARPVNSVFVLMGHDSYEENKTADDTIASRRTDTWLLNKLTRVDDRAPVYAQSTWAVVAKQILQ